MQAPTTAPATQEAILSWLVEQLARELRLPPDTIDRRDPFARYGVDSLVAAELAVALEEWVGHPLPPTLFWDVPSLEAIADAALAS